MILEKIMELLKKADDNGNGSTEIDEAMRIIQAEFDAANEAKKKWESLPEEEKNRIFLMIMEEEGDVSTRERARDALSYLTVEDIDHYLNPEDEDEIA